MPSPATLQALESLRKLSVTPYSPQFDSSMSDVNAQRYQGFQDMEGELKDRVFANQRAQAASPSAQTANQYGGEVTALKNMLGSTQQDIAESPITSQIGEANDYRERERGAIEAGFGGGSFQRGPNQRQYQNPLQAQAQYGREQAEAKLQQPMDIARTQAEAELGKQRVASQGALDVAKEQSRGGLDIQRNFTDFQRSLQGGQGGQQPQSVTMPGRFGGGSINMGAASSRIPKPIPPAVTQAITVARRNYEVAKQSEGMWSGSQASQAAKAALDQAIAAGIYNFPADDPAHKDFVQAILNDPQASKLALDQILQLKGETDVTPDEIAEIQEMLNLFRGF